MVLDGLQTYIETKLDHCINKNVDLRTVQSENEAVDITSSKKALQIFVVHADSCRKYVYPISTDWVCGGQWNEMLNNLEKFVRNFRQSNSELVVFFDGSMSSTRIHEWKSRQANQRETVKQLMSKVVSYRASPSRNLAVIPACFNTALRLALKSCNVIVCSSLSQVHSDITNYYRAQKCSGIIAHSSHYLLQGISNCFSPDHLKIGRYNVRSSCIDFEAVMKELGLTEEALPVFASLIGSVLIPEEYLATFHWTFLAPDHPLRQVELKGHLSNQSVLPPYDIVIKGVADFLKDRDLSDVDSLAAQVFTGPTYDQAEAATKLKESIEYFKSVNQKKLDETTTNSDAQSNINRDGFPVHNFGKPAEEPRQHITNSKMVESSYQQRWHQFQKVQVNTQPLVQTLQDAECAITDEPEDDGKPENSESETSEEKEKTPETAAEEKEKDPSLQEASDEATINGVETSCSEVESEEAAPSAEYCEVHEEPDENVKALLSTIPDEVLSVARKRHQSGEMAQEILQILTRGEILIDTAIDEEHATMRPPVPLLYRPVRELIYGILFDQKIFEESIKEPIFQDAAAQCRHVKEYCVHKGNSLDSPDIVEPKSIAWDIPPVKTLWLGRQAEDNTTRMKAFLTCMKSETQNMSNPAMVPQRLLLLCCVLRYLIQQGGEKSILAKHDIDAFLAQALSPHLTTESNSTNLANLKLNQIDVRAMQLASIFMSGIETAVIANDACGSPVPWEFCCPWLFFDGKLFHSKWLQSSMNVATLELCDGKPQLAQRLERLRWCITEGLNDNFKISGLKPSSMSGSPFGQPTASLVPGPAYGVNDYRPAGANSQHYVNRNKGRGASSKRAVLGSGGTLEVAGVPVAHWSGNKSGIGYHGHSPDIIVGGRTSVDLASEARYSRRGMGRGRFPNRGRGLLPTPMFSPWPVDYEGMRGVQNHFGRGPGGHMPLVGRSSRPQGRSLYNPTSSNTNRRNGYNNHGNNSRNPPKVLSKQSEMWVGRGRGLGLEIPNEEKPAGSGWIPS